MCDEAFAELNEAMEDALAFERGKGHELKVTRIQTPRPSKAMSSREMVQIRRNHPRPTRQPDIA